MADDPNIPVPPAPAPAVETPVPAAPVEEPEALDEAPSGEEPEQVLDDDEELEWDGLKFRVKKSVAEKVKPALMMQADYTRKTQELAAQRAAAAAERDLFQQQARMYEATTKSRSELQALQGEIARYSTVNWAQAFQTDPTAAQIAQATLMQLQMQERQAIEKVRSEEQAFAIQAQQEFAKQLERSRAEVIARTGATNWTEQTDQALTKLGMSYGLAEFETKQFGRDPRLVHILYDNHTLRQLVAKLQAAPRGAVTQQPVGPRPEIEPPAVKVAGKKMVSSGPSDRDPVDVWFQKREKQVAAQRRRPF